ncbi:hypothetical protein Pmar_PMAR015040 [Perkinsus marinus ATCC 50983]|uniref:Uncharacterized protein n=1 Tax=Perkinsus marinus (strain ATCC 50983 / TXsc) TaxID=423536 RepID=C5KRL2_PERM5|nr:hypothetical protein Pmar_PMAR015040 [Perkinsus marinus ATCC 50983]EER12874.1 hypothetical protein Pmar_PMAR015040 [Perkinsus marinus ATCC 50983]|eukprot:XP_002781079.1 hypothetical protein Pmar_PMAR015040 [Perkinsus marinus ATCC 50983]
MLKSIAVGLKDPMLRADLFYGHRINKPWTTLAPDELLNDYEAESLRSLFKQERADAKLRYDEYCEFWQMSRDLQQSALSKKLAGKKSDPQPYPVGSKVLRKYVVRA